MAADASPEVEAVRRCRGRVEVRPHLQGRSRWRPKAPVDLAYTCGWFSGGYQVVCHMAGTILGGPDGELTTRSRPPCEGVHLRQDRQRRLARRRKYRASTWRADPHGRRHGRPEASEDEVDAERHVGRRWNMEGPRFRWGWWPRGDYRRGQVLGREVGPETSNGEGAGRVTLTGGPFARTMKGATWSADRSPADRANHVGATLASTEVLDRGMHAELR